MKCWLAVGLPYNAASAFYRHGENTTYSCARNYGAVDCWRVSALSMIVDDSTLRAQL